LLLPLFSRMIAEKSSVKPLLKTSFTLIFIYGIVLAAVSFFYSYPLMNLLYDAHADTSSEVFHVLMLSIAPLSATYIFGTLLTANGNLKQLNMIAFAAMILNVGLNILLIPYFRAIGSAYISLLTQMLIITAEIVIASKVFSLKISLKYIVRLSGFVLFSGVSGWISVQFPFHWIFNVLILLCFCGISVFIFGLIKPKEIISLIKNKH
jgi:O-antigen/teichoic acid export membrane protein